AIRCRLAPRSPGNVWIQSSVTARSNPTRTPPQITPAFSAWSFHEIDFREPCETNRLVLAACEPPFVRLYSHRTALGDRDHRASRQHAFTGPQPRQTASRSREMLEQPSSDRPGF